MEKIMNALRRQSRLVVYCLAVLVIALVVGILVSSTQKKDAQTKSNGVGLVRKGVSVNSEDKRVDAKPSKQSEAIGKDRQLSPTPGLPESYASSHNPYDFDYPSDWQLSNTKTPTGVEQIELSPKQPSDPKNQFILVFRESPIRDSLAQPRAMVNGAITKLPADLSVWELNKELAYREGPPAMYCPTLRLVESDASGTYHFSHSLGDGKYLTVQGTFCSYEGANPTYSHEEQLTSNEWTEAKNIINSLKF